MQFELNLNEKPIYAVLTKKILIQAHCKNHLMYLAPYKIAKNNDEPHYKIANMLSSNIINNFLSKFLSYRISDDLNY